MKGSWTTPDRRTYVNLRPFNLKIGDRVIFPDFITENGMQSLKSQLHIGKVIGIYPNIFHVEYEIGRDEKHTLKRSFTKVAYQLGEVSKYESY